MCNLITAPVSLDPLDMRPLLVFCKFNNEVGLVVPIPTLPLLLKCTLSIPLKPKEIKPLDVPIATALLVVLL